MFILSVIVYCVKLYIFLCYLENYSLPWLLKTKMAHEIASGMAYLHSLKPTSIMHGDLKSQNVLVGEHFNMKVNNIFVFKITF